MAKLLKFQRVTLVEPRSNGPDTALIDPPAVTSVTETTAVDFYGVTQTVAVIVGPGFSHTVFDGGRKAAGRIQTQQTTQARDAAAIAANPSQR